MKRISNWNKMLLALLVLQAAVITLVYWPAQKPSSAVGHDLFPDLKAAEIHALTISDEHGGMVRLVRQAQGWLIEAAKASALHEEQTPPAIAPPLPADDLKVEGFIDQISGLKASRLVARTPASQQRLQVAEEHFVRRIDLDREDGRSTTIYLGKAPDFRSVHARREGEGEIYLAEGVAALDADTAPSSWWRNYYLDLDPVELRSVTITNGHGSIKLLRDNGWRLEDAGDDEQIAGEPLEELLHRIGRIRLFDYLGREGSIAEAELGLVNPAARVTYNTGGDKIDFRIGAEDKESGLRVAKASSSRFYVRVPSYLLEPILNQQRSALVKE